jgi:hypothetical protein
MYFNLISKNALRLNIKLIYLYHLQIRFQNHL